MANRKTEIFVRIQKAWELAGYRNRSEFLAALEKHGVALSHASLTSYASGQASPNADTIIGIAKTVNCTTDYLLLGTELAKTETDLRVIVEEGLAAIGLSAKGRRDEVSVKISRALDDLTDEEKRVVWNLVTSLISAKKQ